MPTAIKRSQFLNPNYPIVGIFALGIADFTLEEVFNIDLFDFSKTNNVGSKLTDTLTVYKTTNNYNLDIENVIKSIDKLNEDETIKPVTVEVQLPPAGLTTNGTGKCERIDKSNPCDGQRMYELYLWYKNQPDGWWNKDGDFTPADFLGLMLFAEAGGADTEFLKSITFATSSQLWGSSNEHEAYCKTPSCEEGIFNFIGAYMEVASSRYNSYVYNPNPNLDHLLDSDESRYNYFVQNGVNLEDIANDTVYNPISTEYTNDTPVHWGNFGCGEDCDYLGDNWLQNAGNNNINVGTTDRCGLYDIVGQNNSLGVVYTNNQKYNWSLEDSPCFNR